MKTLVELNEVQKSFDGLKVVAGITESIAVGEIVSLFGPSGCGKSTILRLIAGTEVTDTGVITRKVADDKIGFIFQDARLLPWQSTLQNVLFVLKNRIKDPRQREARARDALHRVGLDEFLDYPPTKLSGGMRKRVAIARALAIQAELFLFDEPFSDLDLPMRMLLIKEIKQLLRAGNVTAIYVTHDIREALILSDRIFVLSARPAHIKSIIDLTGIDQKGATMSAELREIEDNVMRSLEIETHRQISRRGLHPKA